MSSVSFSQHIARRLHIPHHPTLAGPKLSTTALSMSSPAKTNGTKPQHMYLINPTVSLLNTKSPATRYVRSKPPAMPLDHFSIIVPLDSLEPLVSWLLAANSPFGFRELTRPVAHAVGLGESRPYLWVVGDSSTEATEAQVREWRKMHVAFTVESTSRTPGTVPCRRSPVFPWAERGGDFIYRQRADVGGMSRCGAGACVARGSCWGWG
ncbi:hypothetical protein PMIN04_008594 [Paraphaeosphaeria minitans]